MSSPVGHAIAGLIFYTVYKHLTPDERWSWYKLVFFVFLAGLPDFDFLWIWIWELPRATTHRTISHSLFFGVTVGVLLAGLFQKIIKKPQKHLYWLVPATIISHDLMDMSCVDVTPPTGVQLFWPFSLQFFYTPLPFMKSAGYYSLPDVPTLLAIVKAAPGEIVVMGSLYLVVLVLLKRRKINPGL